jgi:DNA-binding MarR family transcriptional regulator
MTKKPSQASVPHSRKMDEKDYVALASFRRSLRVFLAFSEQAARRAGLTPQQHQALLAIRGFSEGRDGIAVGDLAAHLLLKHHTAVGLVDRLVRAKLVVRKPDAKDRRRVLLTLASRAIKALDILSAEHLIEMRRNAPELIKLLRQLQAKR